MPCSKLSKMMPSIIKKKTRNTWAGLTASTTMASTTTASTSTTVVPAVLAVADIAGFIVSAPPDGYRATHANDRGDGVLAEISYYDRHCGTFDWDIQVRLREEGEFWAGVPGDHDLHVLADGTVVEILELWDDGQLYGYTGGCS